MAVIDGLLEDLIKRGGSDLHLAVNQPPTARVRGEIVTLREGALAAKELEEMLLELITPAQRARLAADLGLDLAYVYKDVARFRATYYVKHPGIAAAFRLVPARVPSLAELGCPEIVSRLAERRGGLVVVAGPVSNGKTTMTAAMIDHVNRTRACHVITIEQPIEFVHEPARAQITQREVPTHAPTFAAALRSAERENPDVVYLADVSAREDLELALRLAGEGVLVFTNVPTSGAAATIERLVSTFEPEAHARVRALIADCLAGVIVQHLVRSGDGKGRVAVHEILVGTPAIASLVREGKMDALVEAIRSADGQGMQSLDAGLERLLVAGKITAEAAFERSIDKEAFAHVVGRTRPDLVEPQPFS